MNPGYSEGKPEKSPEQDTLSGRAGRGKDFAMIK